MNHDHRATVLEALKFDALETRRRTVQTPLDKTCKWILDHPACAKWLNLEHKFFWIKGKPGAGKSVLIKYLDQHVTRKLKKSKATGLYFYFNARGEQLEKSFVGLYRSLLVQLVHHVPQFMHELDALDTQFDLLQLQTVLTSAILGLGTQIWLFIDALDECREGDVRDLIEFLDGLHEAELYVCLASRHYPIHKIPTDLQLVLEEVDQHKQDLSTYVGKLDLEGEELALMQRDIVAKANGIFLWVVLVVGILQKDVERGRFHAMRLRLREIPQGLSELFKTIILRDDEHKDEFLLCLRWILYAFRPLTLKEWYFAMMAGVDGRLEWVEADTERRIETFLVSSSKGLAELTKGKTVTAQFIHESVRDFLIHQNGFEEICGDQESSESNAHEQLKHCCLRGIAFALPRQLKQRPGKKELLAEEERSSLRAKRPFAEYATTYVIHHADAAAIGFPQQHFLTNEFIISDWISQFNAFQNTKPEIYGAVPSFSYLCAERNLAKLMPRPTEALSREKQRYGIPLIAAIVRSSWQVVKMFLTDLHDPNIDETIAELRVKTKFDMVGSMRIPWHWAVRNNLAHLLRCLLMYLSKGEVDVLGYHGTALHLASERGHEKIAQMLLDVGADVNAQGGNYGNALQAASGQGHEQVVQILLDAGADVSAQGGKYGNALQAASARGHEKVVQILLDTGANVNAQGGLYGNALQVASMGGLEKVVQMLLDAGADVNAQRPLSPSDSNALQAASSRGHEKVVQILLDAGAVAHDQS